MSSRCLRIALALSAMAAPAVAQARELRVCSDPNNLPFSDAQGRGFENRIAELIAADLKANLEYYWFAQRRGFLRNTLNAHHCDMVVGIPAGMDMLLTTQPYYRSSYVFVQRPSAPPLDSFDDPALKTLKIGVQLTGNDGVNTPPAHELADRGVTSNIRGFMVYGDYRKEQPLRDIVDAVASGDIGVAVVWGPEAGWFAQQETPPLRLSPVEGATSGLPMSFDIAMGVRKGELDLARDLDEAIDRHRDEIRSILTAYHVPQLPVRQDKAETAP